MISLRYIVGMIVRRYRFWQSVETESFLSLHILSVVICKRWSRHSMRGMRSEEHTSELQSRFDLVCRLLLEKKKLDYDADAAAQLVMKVVMRGTVEMAQIQIT